MGNYFFRSNNIELGNTYSRRDDLISIMYIVIHMINGFEPITRRMNAQNLGPEFARYKRDSSALEFCTKAETLYLLEAMEYTYRLGYSEQPDYYKLVFMLEKVLMDWDHIPSTKYSWVFDDRHLSDHESSDQDEENSARKENISQDGEERKI